jgi:hypothetical protein
MNGWHAPRSVPGFKKPSKYRNEKFRAGGIVHASKKQAWRWLELLAMEKRGEIINLRREVDFPIVIRGIKVCTYRADHVYEWLVTRTPDCSRWCGIVEDVKGVRTPMYELKKKLMKAVLGIDILEV